MEKLISFETSGKHTIYIEATETVNSGGMRPVSQGKNAVVDKAAVTLEEALEPVKSVSKSFLNAFKDTVDSPHEVTVELAIKVTAEAGLIITKGSVEGNFKITLTWKKS